MHMDIATLLQKASIWAIPVLLAVTLHEAAHGYMARRYGDMTATMMGRVTLNPLKHIDPFGTIILPLLTLALTSMGGTPFVFGYAKPVPVNFGRLSHRPVGEIMVSLAGPMTNFLLAILSALALWVALYIPIFVGKPLALMAVASIQINLILMWFNLMPILPLDGGRVIYALLKGRAAATFARLEPYGMMIIIILALTGFLGVILGPLYAFSIHLLGPILPMG